MANYLMQPPATGNKTTNVNGRIYIGVLGTPVTVPDFDLDILEANGWVAIATTGTTAQRPTTMLFVGRKYVDTTLTAHITWDGKTWRNSITGASV